MVEFLVQRFGSEQLKAILSDLGQGIEINQALEKHTVAITKLDEEFAAFARDRAEKLAPGLDFEKPEFAKHEKENAGHKRGSKPSAAPASAEAWDAWAKDRPTNFWAIEMRAQELVEAKKWQEAKPILQRLVELYPGFTGPESAYRMLAAAHRALGETNSEKQVLARFAEQDKEAPDVFLRLMELDATAKDWPAV